MSAGPEFRFVERPSMELLKRLGWQIVDAFQEELGAGGTLGRDSQAEVILGHRLREAVERLNPPRLTDVEIPARVFDEAIAEVMRDRSLMDPVRANRELYGLLRDGYRAEWEDDAGERQFATIRFMDFDEPGENDLLAVQQLWVKGPLHSRRVDAALFINGVPLVLMEFKEPSVAVKVGYDTNITDYRDTIPGLFVPNLLVLISNGGEAKVGSTYAPWEFFSDWAVIDAQGTRGQVALETALRGTCTPDVLLDLFENFVAFLERSEGLIKVVARSHQYLGVNAAIENMQHARSVRDKRLGVFWHTQGSGKSLSMLWFTQKVLHRIPGNWTFVMITDRVELDTQLHREFAAAGAIPAEAKVHADSIAHLRTLLAADHRYVFTLIHKFQPSKALGERIMPVLSERDDVIVITDEAHRSQYDTLALNMRTALPNASMMGFTGTPLIEGEEEATRQQFGDYVSIYNFRAAIQDGSTVPLYYENRIPELQLVNENFTDDLNTLLEEAELDDDAEGALARQFATQYMLLTRPERLKTIARDMVRHFVGRGFAGKAMYVGLDKAAAVRMYDLVQAEWVTYLEELRAEHNRLPVLERPWLASRIELMETTDMAVVVSQGQNEIKELQDKGLDIRPHRERMNNEDLAEKFKDSSDQLRLVFVCAMWMTGFDAPSVSTIYLDRPMRNHTLMQTIARANRVFPDKENGLIIDYVGVFRNLEKALAVYGAGEGNGDSPIQFVDELARELDDAVNRLINLCEGLEVSITRLQEAEGFDFIALRNRAGEILLETDDIRTEFMLQAHQVRRLFKALLPNPQAATHQRTVAAIRALDKYITSTIRPTETDLSSIADAVDALLDRSVGAEEYVIRAAADGVQQDPLVDLSLIDFETLKEKFAGRERAETDRLAQLLKQRTLVGAKRNPTRAELVERIEALIDEYNAGSLNINEYLRRLIDLSKTMDEEEERSAREGMTEEQLAIFDLLTKPDPILTDEERETVHKGAKALLEHLHEVIVQDWHRKAEVLSDVDSTIRRVLDQHLPDPYTVEIFNMKVERIYEHVLTAYGDYGDSVYDRAIDFAVPANVSIEPARGIDVDTLTEDVIQRLHTDPDFAAQIAQQLVEE